VGLSKGGLEGVDPLGSLDSLDLSIDDDLNDLGTDVEASTHQTLLLFLELKAKNDCTHQSLLLCLWVHCSFCKMKRICEEVFAFAANIGKTSLEGVQVFEEVHDVFGGVPVVFHVSYLITSSLNFALTSKSFSSKFTSS